MAFLCAKRDYNVGEIPVGIQCGSRRERLRNAERIKGHLWAATCKSHFVYNVQRVKSAHNSPQDYSSMEEKIGFLCSERRLWRLRDICWFTMPQERGEIFVGQRG